MIYWKVYYNAVLPFKADRRYNIMSHFLSLFVCWVIFVLVLNLNSLMQNDEQVNSVRETNQLLRNMLRCRQRFAK